jgi:4-diphosphocytidyl-2-C-methyl-D-erythritol kinase
LPFASDAFLWYNPDVLTVCSYAKVNLCLKIVGRRPDGYHDLCSIFQTVSLGDRLTFRARNDERINVVCDDPSIPSDGRNLAVRAAELLRRSIRGLGRASGRPLGADIGIQKRIPAGAGLGGGSSNAAATLTALLKLWRVNKFAKKTLCEIAAEVGSDVPYFLTGGTCLVTGRGERIKRLPPVPKLNLLIIFPGIHVSTAWAYSKLSLALTKRLKYSKIMERLFQGRPGPGRISGIMENDLETAVIGRHPAIARAKSDLTAAGALNSLMSGSGSSVFGVFPDRASARKAWQLLSRRWPESHLAESVAGT